MVTSPLTSRFYWHLSGKNRFLMKGQEAAAGPGCRADRGRPCNSPSIASRNKLPSRDRSDSLKRTGTMLSLASLSPVFGGAGAGLQGLAAELNALAADRAQALATARQSAANLAHALKTPMTVLMNESEGQASPLAETVRRQTASMRRHVDHQVDPVQIGELDGAHLHRRFGRVPLRGVIVDPGDHLVEFVQRRHHHAIALFRKQ